jgi:hypothetical protein
MLHGRMSCRLVLSLSMLVAGAATALAQPVCFGPDGLDGSTLNCCQPTSAILPTFPAFQGQSFKYVCFDNCNVQINVNLCAQIGAPQPVLAGGGVVCGVYLIRFTMTTCAGGMPTLWSGNMRAHYSRTWIESSTPGAVPDIQVWRFLLNGDLVPGTGLPTANPCAFAPCIPASGGKLHVWGFIDYAGSCTSAGGFRVAWALNHGCDFSEHGPGSARPGAFHPTKSYTWVGPSAGFVVDPVTTTLSNGNAAPGQDAIRKNQWSTLPAICLFEEPLQISSIFPNGTFCACGGGGPQYDRSIFRAIGQCGTTISQTPGAAIPFMQKRIGRWVGGAFPGNEELLLDEGFLTVQEGCVTGSILPQYVQGVETIGGFPAFKAGTAPLIPLDRQFEDLATANRGPANSAIVIGAPYISWFIVNINLP